jgi:hypothetical protein
MNNFIKLLSNLWKKKISVDGLSMEGYNPNKKKVSIEGTTIRKELRNIRKINKRFDLIGKSKDNN